LIAGVNDLMDFNNSHSIQSAEKHLREDSINTKIEPYKNRARLVPPIKTNKQ